MSSTAGRQNTAQQLRNIQRLARAAVVSLLAIAGTTGGCDSTSGPAASRPDAGAISVSLNPTSGSIQQHVDTTTTTTATVTLTRSGEFTGAVNLTVTGAPAWVTAAVSNVQTSGTTTTGTVTLTVPAAAAEAQSAAGVYPLVVHGLGAGVAEATANYSLAVAAPLPAAAYVLAFETPGSMAVWREYGLSATARVYVDRINFRGSITLAMENLPPDVTATFAPNPVSGNSSMLTLTAASTSPNGTFTNLLVRGVTTELTDRTTPLSFTIAERGFTLSLTSPALTVAKGGSSATNVNVFRTSFAGPVRLIPWYYEDGSLPAGVTVAFAPNPVAGDIALLTVTVSAPAVAGVYDLDIYGEGAPDVWFWMPLKLTITAPAPNNQ
jgi:hypothetical protein